MCILVVSDCFHLIVYPCLVFFSLHSQIFLCAASAFLCVNSIKIHVHTDLNEWSWLVQESDKNTPRIWLNGNWHCLRTSNKHAFWRRHCEFGVCVCVGCKMVQISPSAAKKSQSHGTHVYEIGTADIEFTKLTANINWLVLNCQPSLIDTYWLFT